ncbi:unnamed protein product [Adineta ricciae]|uniref:Uncharacterized protein n=1 Tax=Adineta ricciae TaxID=249248 RepID=A0A815UNM0_ADIRI|nr:unnamed protein product [Adineta ricciae]
MIDQTDSKFYPSSSRFRHSFRRFRQVPCRRNRPCHNNLGSSSSIMYSSTTNVDSCLGENVHESSIVQNSILDIVALQSDVGFKIGKITNIKGKTYSITLFYFKLGSQNEVFMEDDILVNFGSCNSRNMFDFDKSKLKYLFDKLNETDPDHCSLIQLLKQLELKDQVCLFPCCRSTIKTRTIPVSSLYPNQIHHQGKGETQRE